jgi:outer membrane protein assembly factor BamB
LGGAAVKGDQENLEGIGGGAFLDEDGSVETRKFTSGRGKVSGSRGRSHTPRAEVLCGPDGRMGWRIGIPGNRPLATPAVSDGKLFVGAGFGSHEFHAVAADNGEPLWQIQTGDDGPTAAVVAEGRVAFNTESCTVYVVDAEDGRVVWERWLGDPLMAQPAFAGPTVLMAYPDKRARHWLAALRVDDGETVWETEIVADVITAPVIADGSAYATAIEGTVYRLDLETGKVLWSKQHRATSAPWIHDGRIFVSLRDAEEEGAAASDAVEGFDTIVMGTGARGSRKTSSSRYASYLHAKRSRSRSAAYYHAQDAHVGFSSAPSSAKLHLAHEHLGLHRVSSVWSFQGSRPAAFDDGIFACQGDAVQRLDIATKKPVWRCRLEVDDDDAIGQVLSPPAVTSTRLYVTSAFGDLFVLDRVTGEEVWALNVGTPILSQPAVADGKVYLGTADGTLYGFEADDPDAAGWPMWGGGPGHNGS